MKILLIVLLIGLSFEQNCPQLCTAPCTNGICSSCYLDFPMTSLLDPTKTCACPPGYFLNATSNLCNFCPVYCLTCNNYTSCKTCIPGYELANNYTCIIKVSNDGGWAVMNVSYDITNLISTANGFSIIINSTTTPIDSSYISSNNYTFYSYCQKIPSQFFGASTFNSLTQVLKSSFALPIHDWLHIRFQFIAVDYWLNDGIVL